jgi:hypothetical protein
MKFLSGTVGQDVMEEIEDAVAVDIASAYFSPGDDEIDALKGVPELRIYVSKEFDVFDPRRLEPLSDTAAVKCIPVDADEGRFHAKVVFCRRPDGSKVAFVGSANFTGPGLFRNHETCVKLDTRSGEESALEDVESWIDRLGASGVVPDWDRAKSIYDSASQRGSPAASEQPNRSEVEGAPNFWVLKTRSGKTWADFWQKFKSEEIVAIGWEQLSLDPSNSSREEIERQLRTVYDEEEEGSPSRSAATILKFVDQWEKGDLVLLCMGFPANASSDIYFYGYARIEGDFFVDEDDTERKFKRPATLQDVEIHLPKDLYTEALQRGSLIGTMHGLTEEQSFNFSGRVEAKHGVSLKL